MLNKLKEKELKKGHMIIDPQKYNINEFKI